MDGSDAGQRALDWAVGEAARRATTGQPASVQAITAYEYLAGGRAAAGADLLVVGSHGHSRMHTAVLGSVAESCIRAATCPVLVIPVVPKPR